MPIGQGSSLEGIMGKTETEELRSLRAGLESMEGPEMREILDREFELNSAQSPVSSTDAKRTREYDEWLRTLNFNKGANQSRKSDLERRIKAKRAEISKLTEGQ